MCLNTYLARDAFSHILSFQIPSAIYKCNVTTTLAHRLPSLKNPVPGIRQLLIKVVISWMDCITQSCAKVADVHYVMRSGVMYNHGWQRY